MGQQPGAAPEPDRSPQLLSVALPEPVDAAAPAGARGGVARALGAAAPFGLWLVAAVILLIVAVIGPVPVKAPLSLLATALVLLGLWARRQHLDRVADEQAAHTVTCDLAAVLPPRLQAALRGVREGSARLTAAGGEPDAVLSPWTSDLADAVRLAAAVASDAEAAGLRADDPLVTNVDAENRRLIGRVELAGATLAEACEERQRLLDRERERPATEARARLEARAPGQPLPSGLSDPWRGASGRGEGVEGPDLDDSPARR